jgi:nucleoside-diphosphate-sugar epimerase
MAKLVVTGGSGKAGRAVVRDLLTHGHEVRNVDRVPSPESNSPDTPARFLPAELTGLGQTLEALDGAEIVVHLAAIPSPSHATPGVTFRTNVMSTYAVFAAAQRLGVERVVWASSETTIGFPFDEPPEYVPVDEDHVRLESSYALSKIVGEEMARQSSRWTGVPFIGLRLSNVIVHEEYPRRRERAVLAGRRRAGRRLVHHRRRRHRDAAAEPRADAGGLPRRCGARGPARARHPVEQRQGAARAGQRLTARTPFTFFDAAGV